MKIEQRILSRPVELRAVDANSAKSIAGHASVFWNGSPDTEYVLWDDARERMTERIAPGAFDRALRENSDVVAVIDHEMARLLGRRAAGTLKLAVDAVGLRYDVTLPDTQYARDLVASVTRGDIAGSSFAFRARGQTFEERQEGTKTYVTRTVTDVDLFDVGPVAMPAYKATTTGIRSALEDSRREVLAALHAREAERVRVALRVMSLGN